MLLIATVVALVWANSPWGASYHHLWEAPIGLTLGGFSGRWTLHHLVNDGLMAVFFFLVGLEIKREFIAGELRTTRTAALPMVAAFGGMLVPAVIYLALNGGTASARGWGVPVATDIAFALGVLAILGARVPVGLKVFLAALAIVDDLGAVLVIAVFYSTGLHWGALGTAGGLLAVAALANLAGVRRPWAYAVIGTGLWAAVASSGVHATVAGVLLALTIPVRTRIHEGAFLSGARKSIADFDAAAARSANRADLTALSNADHHAAIEELETLAEQVQPPLIRMEHALRTVVAFGIMPLFALSNAGVALSADAARALFDSPVAPGVFLGLLIGKPVGILTFSWIAVRWRLAALPGGVTWPMIAGAGMLGGIGFTMALFVAGLAFSSPEMLDVAKIAIFAGSTVAGIVGWLFLHKQLKADR